MNATHTWLLAADALIVLLLASGAGPPVAHAAALTCADHANCPPGWYCLDGTCNSECEYDGCGVAATCDVAAGRCRPIECDADTGCPEGTVCRLDDGPGYCIPACEIDGCVAGEQCTLLGCLRDRCDPGRILSCGGAAVCVPVEGGWGECVPACEGGEYLCAPGERCDRRSGRCVSPRCEKANCASGESCDNRDGKCYPHCPGYDGVECGGAAGHRVCVHGRCVSDCFDTGCPEGTQCFESGCNVPCPSNPAVPFDDASCYEWRVQNCHPACGSEQWCVPKLHCGVEGCSPYETECAYAGCRSDMQCDEGLVCGMIDPGSVPVVTLDRDTWDQVEADRLHVARGGGNVYQACVAPCPDRPCDAGLSCDEANGRCTAPPPGAPRDEAPIACNLTAPRHDGPRGPDLWFALAWLSLAAGLAPRKRKT